MFTVFFEPIQVLTPTLNIGYLTSEVQPLLLGEVLSPDRYCLRGVEFPTNESNFDCFLIFDPQTLPQAPDSPLVLIAPNPPQRLRLAATYLHPEALNDLPKAIDRAISQFLAQTENNIFTNQQQRTLATKLKERLGYLGVFYKRYPDQFLRAMAPNEQKKALDILSEAYYSIVIEYFKQTPDRLNQKIDEFTCMVFLADVSVSQILEIHMNLMDELGKQLRIEGHKDEILLDYRITLIDVIAHLCEMYRRSIPPKIGTL